MASLVWSPVALNKICSPVIYSSSSTESVTMLKSLPGTKPDEAGNFEIDHAELAMMLQGIDMASARRRERYRVCGWCHRLS